jgi:murein DD-endopeptidase MepM/ murein hydrolase activator NlpD
MTVTDLRNILRKNSLQYHPVVPFEAGKQALYALDLSATNVEAAKFSRDTASFSHYIKDQLEKHNADYLVGGYNELRVIYDRSSLFDGTETVDVEPRRLHIGTDIWAKAGTPVYTPLGGMIHSFAFNDQLGDYGATIILLHQLDGFAFYTLYGHLSKNDINRLSSGDYIARGVEFAHLGQPHENGHWPPHLHFQLILDIGLYSGDYPGVCKYSERAYYLSNCPDPDLILQFKQYLK